jgi:hypothetical protein
MDPHEALNSKSVKLDDIDHLTRAVKRSWSITARCMENRIVLPLFGQTERPFQPCFLSGLSQSSPGRQQAVRSGLNER